jgi:hypothetical protein
MAIDLYSKATLDTLLAAKLADAPSDGSQYARQDGSWQAIVAGSAVWGSITGDVTNQTDLTTYLSGNYYPLSSNPAGFLTSVPGKSVNQAAYGSYTLVSTDANNIVHSTGGGNVIIPQDSTYSFPVGTVIIVTDTSTGTQVVPEVYGGSVAPFINGGVSGVSVGYGVTCVKIGADQWNVF